MGGKVAEPSKPFSHKLIYYDLMPHAAKTLKMHRLYMKLSVIDATIAPYLHLHVVQKFITQKDSSYKTTFNDIVEKIKHDKELKIRTHVQNNCMRNKNLRSRRGTIHSSLLITFSYTYKVKFSCFVGNSGLSWLLSACCLSH